MGQFHGLCTKATGKVTSKETFRELQRAAADAQEATAKVAERVSRPLLHRKLRYSEKQRAKPIVHYAFGSAVGAVYGATAEYAPSCESLLERHLAWRFSRAPISSRCRRFTSRASPVSILWRCTPQNLARTLFMA
jgi:hypothetical protein